jgi:hypothetical protein
VEAVLVPVACPRCPADIPGGTPGRAAIMDTVDTLVVRRGGSLTQDLEVGVDLHMTWRQLLVKVMTLTGLHTSPNYVTGSWIWIIPAGVITPMIMLAIGRNYTKKYGIECPNVNEVKGYLDMFIPNEIKNFTGRPRHGHLVDICLADLPGDIPFFLHPAYRDVSRQCHTFYNNRIIPLHDVERIARMCSSFLLMRSILDLDDIGFYANTEQRVLAMSDEDYDVLSRDLSRYLENPFSIERVASTRQFAYREIGLEL